MFSTPIILVDNEQDHLNKLNQAFALSGLPCLPILYKQEPDNVSGIDHVNADTKNARIIALDINLTNVGGVPEAKALYGAIASVLEKLAPVGPYYLVFWSRHKNLPDELIALFRRPENNISAPIGYGFLDKSDFLEEDSIDLKEELFKLINEVCIFRLMLGWELRTNYAASHTLSNLYRIAATPHDNGWKREETKEKLITLLIHIAHESVGHKNSKDSANHAVETGLLPILEDNLLGMTSDEDSGILNSEWEGCLKKLGDRKALEALGEDDISNLNTFYNLEEVPMVYSKCKRGVFVEITEDILSDPDKLSSTFGKHADGLSGLVKEEFVFKGKTNKRAEIIDASIFGWLEIGASCDHAQLKNKLYRYLFGMLIPVEYKDYLYSESNDIKDRAHEGVYRSPVLKYKDKNYILFFSFRYQVGVYPDSELLGIPRFRMKEQILNEIVFRWSKYCIRPGITSFR